MITQHIEIRLTTLTLLDPPEKLNLWTNIQLKER